MKNTVEDCHLNALNRFFFCAENIDRVVKSLIAQSLVTDSSLLTAEQIDDCTMVLAFILDLSRKN